MGARIATDCVALQESRTGGGWCQRFNHAISECPAHCRGYKVAQPDLFSAVDGWDTELDAWIRENPSAYAAIERKFRQLASSGRRISVRDIWSWARMEFAFTAHPAGGPYSFNNNLTPALSIHLGEKFPEHAHLIQRRGANAEVCL